MIMDLPSWILAEGLDMVIIMVSAINGMFFWGRRE